MDQALTLLHQQEWRIMDYTTAGPNFTPIESFALDDTLCESVGTGKSPAVARSWVHRNIAVLGIQDVRLPYLESGIEWLKQEGYEALVRTSGGLCVLLDEGILNLTLIFPERDQGIAINQGYEAMYQFIQLMFKDLTTEIKAGEIDGSYCPGSYDLSIDGKKFAGISQRRLKKGVAVQIYLCVSGSGSQRAEIVRRFYEKALQGEETKIAYPKIKPEVMASLSELLGINLTVEDCMFRFLKALQMLSGDQLYNSELTAEESQRYPYYYGRIVERNEKWLSR